MVDTSQQSTEDFIMLKISIENSAQEKRFILEGSFTKDWCNSLLDTWENERKDLGNRDCTVDLKKISLIDDCGMAILSEMSRASVKFRASGMLLWFLLRGMNLKVA
jgi:ABC-type transporter Mla MlaB component